jgi:hypothetical protein
MVLSPHKNVVSGPSITFVGGISSRDSGRHIIGRASKSGEADLIPDEDIAP